MNLDTILDLARTALEGKSRYGLVLCTKTKCRLTKGETAQVAGDKDILIEKVAIIKNGFLGRNYERCVAKRTTTGEYDAQKPTGMHWLTGFEDVVLEADKDATKHYLRVAFDWQSKVETHFLVAGEKATDKQDALIRQLLQAKVKPCEKQKSAGVEEEVVVRSYSTESIMAIKAWGMEAETNNWEALLNLLN